MIDASRRALLQTDVVELRWCVKMGRGAVLGVVVEVVLVVMVGEMGRVPVQYLLCPVP